MNRHTVGILSIILFYSVACSSQLENVRVETYYISTAMDATDTTGGTLQEGSKTYRIFIDMLPGSSIRSIYSNEDHPLIFSASLPFYNHQEEGVTFGKDLNKNRYEIGTVALDSYLTIGQCSKAFPEGAYAGIPKEKDDDGSLVGGINNDGGSEGIPNGLLTNTDTDMGIPLTTSDGMVTIPKIPDSWIDIGFKNILTGADTTIFGVIGKSTFHSTEALLRNSGVQGPDTMRNEVLIAQLTTAGNLSFEINLEMEIMEAGIPHIIKYVARNELLGDHEVFSPLLAFPYTCGCTDPDYLEASTTFACTDNSKCQTLIVIGCMDSLACNYNRQANLNLPELCCYVGYCLDKDISVACPDLKLRDDSEQEHIRLYPNPASTEIHVELSHIQYNEFAYRIYDMLGRIVLSGTTYGQGRAEISDLDPGSYSIQLLFGDKIRTLPFVKI